MIEHYFTLLRKRKDLSWCQISEVPIRPGMFWFGVGNEPVDDIINDLKKVLRMVWVYENLLPKGTQREFLDCFSLRSPRVLSEGTIW